MLKKLYAIDLLNQTHTDDPVEFYGWVKARRRHNHIVFLDVVDSTGGVQVAVDKAVDIELYKIARTMVPEMAIKVVGLFVETGRSKPPKEIRASSIEVVGPASLPISPQPRSDLDIFDPKYTEQLLDKRYFYLRNEKIAAILKFRHVLTRIVHDWFNERGFIEIHAPVLTPTPLYDDRTPIGLKVHGQDVYLTQCVGFYLEQAVHAFEKIYNMGPSFRAEEGRSKRHLMEYWHIKAEIAFIDREGLIKLVEEFFRVVSGHCAVHGAELAKTIGTELCLDGLSVPFPRITYREAVDWLKKQGIDFEFGKSLGSEEEALLSNRFDNSPFWIVGIPRSIEPFPYVIDPTDPRLTMTADLIASRGYGELLGIAEKIHTLPMLDERLAEKGKAGDARYEWLRELRQYGCVPHGGFGMGLERLIRWFLQIPYVRDAIPFHRAFGRRIHP